MWIGTVRAPPLKEQLRAAAIARCEAPSVMPSHYAAWLGSDLSSRVVEARTDALGLEPFTAWAGFPASHYKTQWSECSV